MGIRSALGASRCTSASASARIGPLLRRRPLRSDRPRASRLGHLRVKTTIHWQRARLPKWRHARRLKTVLTRCEFNPPDPHPARLQSQGAQRRMQITPRLHRPTTLRNRRRREPIPPQPTAPQTNQLTIPASTRMLPPRLIIRASGEELRSLPCWASR
jgi:hypothetical protein